MEGILLNIAKGTNSLLWCGAGNYECGIVCCIKVIYHAEVANIIAGFIK